MRVAFITNLCTHYRRKLFTLLSERHHFDFYFFDDEEKTKEDIKHLTVFKDGERFFYLSTLNIMKRLWEHQYGVIIKCTNNKLSFLCSFLAAKLLKAKFIVWHTIWHYPETFQYRYFSWVLLKILKNHTDAIVVHGEHGKRFLVKKEVSPEKIFIAWQTVDNEIFGKDVEDIEVYSLRGKLNIPREQKIILFVGRLVEIKGLKYLLEALNRLDKSKFSFVAIGAGSEREKLEKYCHTFGIHARFIGLIPHYDLAPYYRMATVLVLPSITTKTLRELWGLVVNEGFNQGCPAVVTDAVGAGVGGLIKEGVNGFVVPEKDIDSLADRIGIIMNNDELRETFSKNALAEIKGWTYERQADGFTNAVKYAFGGDLHESS